jgi:Bacterial Ig-like domain
MNPNCRWCHNAQMKIRLHFAPKLELRHGLVGLMLVLTACPTEPPVAPVLTTPAANSTTSNNQPSIGGTAVAGNTVNVYELPQPARSSPRLTPLSPTVCSSVVNADNTWACVPTVAFLNGIHTITASQTDSSSNASPNSEALNFTVQAISPVPSITSPAVNAILNTSFPNFAGNGVTGSTVSVIENQKTLCTAIVTNNTWTCNSSALLNGVHNVIATQIVPLGATSPASAPLIFAVQVVVPAPNVLSPSANIGRLSNTLEFSGTGIAKNTVTIFEGVTVICSAVVSDAALWSCKPTSLPSDGAHAFNAVQTNLEGINSETTPVLPVNLHALPLIGTLNLEWNTSNKITSNDSSNTFAFKPLSYSDIDDVAGGYRYLTMTFEVSALSGIAVENLSLQAINLPISLAGTAISDLRAFPDAANPLGAAITEPVVVQNVFPTHGTQLGTKPEPAPNSSDFQGFSSGETQSLETVTKTAKLLGADDNLLEFGFVARNAGGGRSIDGSSKNYISVGVKLPRRYTFALFPSCPNPAGCLKPYTFKINFLVHSSPTLRVTRGLGETTSTALTRAVALGTLEKPTQLMLIGSDTDAPTDPKITVLRVPNLKIGTAPTLLPTP